MALAGTAAFGTAATDQQLMAITSDPGAVRADAHLRPFDRGVHLVASTSGIAFIGDRGKDAYDWSEVVAMHTARGAIVVKTEQLRHKMVTTKQGSDVRRFVERKTRRLELVVDDVEEPRLATTFLRILEEVRAGSFSPRGTAWHEHLNAVDRARGEFSDQDDHVMPLAAAGLWLSIGLMSMLLVAVLINSTSARSIPPGAFSLTHRVGPFDPRSVVAAFAFSSLVTMLVLRVALGGQAVVWARGIARGWHRARGRTRAVVLRALGRVLLSTSASAAILLLALLSFWPSIAATVLVDKHGVRNEVLVPLVSIDQGWSGVVEIARDPLAGPADRVGVRYRFADGRELFTQGLELGGGTELQLFELSVAWRAEALVSPR